MSITILEVPPVLFKNGRIKRPAIWILYNEDGKAIRVVCSRACAEAIRSGQGNAACCWCND